MMGQSFSSQNLAISWMGDASETGCEDTLFDKADPMQSIELAGPDTCVHCAAKLGNLRASNLWAMNGPGQGISLQEI